MPLVPEPELLEEIADRADALLLSGGVDVSPLRYGGENPGLCGEISPERDELEWLWLDVFVKRKKPVLGICRGIQVINVYFGGSLWQDLPTQKGTMHRNVNHKIVCRENSILDKLFGREFSINSFHHQSVLELGEGLIATAYSEDVVEAIEHRTLPIFGVQFHPERMLKEVSEFGGPNMQPLFDYFVKDTALCF